MGVQRTNSVVFEVIEFIGKQKFEGANFQKRSKDETALSSIEIDEIALQKRCSAKFARDNSKHLLASASFW